MSSCGVDPNADPLEGLLEKLKLEKWPGPYIFKFILPGGDTEKMKAVKACFDGKNTEMKVQKSKTGKYISLSIKIKKIYNPEAIIELYREVSKIEGVMAL